MFTWLVYCYTACCHCFSHSVVYIVDISIYGVFVYLKHDEQLAMFDLIQVV